LGEWRLNNRPKNSDKYNFDITLREKTLKPILSLKSPVSIVFTLAQNNNPKI
jgi:hypothetical protein